MIQQNSLPVDSFLHVIFLSFSERIVEETRKLGRKIGNGGFGSYNSVALAVKERNEKLFNDFISNMEG